MSYTDSVKEALLNIPVKSACCRRALLYGITAARGHAVSDNECSISIERDLLIELTLRLIREQFGRHAVVARRLHGKEAYTLSFSSPSAISVLSDCEQASLSTLKELRCKDCRNALLRGIFLAAGRISDPQKNYHLEFSFDRPKDSVAAFLADLGYPPKHSQRRKEYLLYYKDNAVIAELLSHCGAANAGFAFINAMIEKQYRSDAGRRANCETGNIAKAVEASMRQVDVITRLQERNLLSSLPSELILTAEYKLKHPNLPLSQLAALMTPPITKSGLSHRLSKIEDLAKLLLKEETN